MNTLMIISLTIGLVIGYLVIGAVFARVLYRFGWLDEPHEPILATVGWLAFLPFVAVGALAHGLHKLITMPKPIATARDGRYDLADDTDTPLIEVVLDAERRADPDWEPAANTLAELEDITGRLWTGTRSQDLMIFGPGVQFEPQWPGTRATHPDCADCEWVDVTTPNGSVRYRDWPCAKHRPQPTRPSPARNPDYAP